MDRRKEGRGQDSPLKHPSLSRVVFTQVLPHPRSTIRTNNCHMEPWPVTLQGAGGWQGSAPVAWLV